MTEVFGIAATVLAVAGVVTNNRRMIVCFYLWMISNAVSLGLHATTGLWSLAVRDGIFFVLCIEGIWRWRREPINNHEGHEGHGEKIEDGKSYVDTEMMTAEEIGYWLGLSTTTVLKKFPKPCNLGKGEKRWKRKDVIRWAVKEYGEIPVFAQIYFQAMEKKS